MILFCKCGYKNTIEDDDSLTCKNCFHHLIVPKQNKILVCCSSCKLGQQINFLPIKSWKCKSCTKENIHPLKRINVGNGNKFAVPTKKTTINLDVVTLQHLDAFLEQLNQDNQGGKIKRGQFIRLLLKKQFGLKC
tara:strand:+ start:174 stop:578 length:405 start_codon:yes stop_codon:yes gene_type:complete